MKFLRKFAALFLILVLSMSLFGCKKEVAAPQKNYNGIELVYYKMFDDSDTMQPIINDYVVKHPGLKIRYRKFTDFNEYESLILNEMAEGEGPDIFSMPNTWFASNYKKLTPVPETYGTPKDFASTFVDVAYKDLVRGDADGVEKIYGVPMYVDTLALFYNKGHFEDRIPQSGRPSATWEGIKEDVYLLNKPSEYPGLFDVSGIAMGRVDNVSRALDIWYLLLLQNGANFYNENMSRVVFASRSADYPALSAMDLYTSFSDASTKNFSWNEMSTENYLGKEIEVFANGSVSMIIGYSYYYQQILDYISKIKGSDKSFVSKDMVKIAPIPQIYDPNVSTQKRVAYANYFAEGVSRNSENADIAWDFLLFLSNKKNLQNYNAVTHRPASRRDLIDEQSKDPVYGVFATQVGYAESFPIVNDGVFAKVFTNLITKANENGANLAELVKAQDELSKLLPSTGLLTKIVPQTAK